MLLSEILVMKTNYWIKQEEVCDLLILVHQNSCFLFFEHHECLPKMAVKFDMPLLTDT